MALKWLGSHWCKWYRYREQFSGRSAPMSVETRQRPLKQRSGDHLLQSLQEAIDTGRWKPGERMPTERALSVQYGVARNTIRRALQQLEDAGRIARHFGRGTFVEQG